MVTSFEGSVKDDAVLEIHQNNSEISFFIYYPGEQSVGSRISFDRANIQKVIDHLQNILDH